MKKLALALVCLVSVAFFASCTPENPEPSIAIKVGEGYVTDGAVLNLNTEYNLGIRAASNSQTMKELSTFRIVSKIFSLEGLELMSEDTTFSISGNEYVYEEVLSYIMEAKELVAKATITATVTDVANYSKTLTINLSLNQPAIDLEETAFEWYRLGNTITGLDEYGLEWKGNYPKDTYAKLIPMDGVKLFIFGSEDWDNVKTDLDKAAFFSNAIETMHTADEYWEVNVTQGTMTYDDVIGTIMPDGTCNLIHVTGSHSETVSGQGTATTITGMAK